MPNQNNNSNAKKVLIVDDDKMLLDMYQIKFSKAGYDCRVIQSTSEAMKVIRDGFLPDVLIVDILMATNMDGLEFVAKVKSEKLLPNAIFMMLTNNSNPDDIAKSKRLNIDSFIIKATAVPSDILNEVTNMLRAKNSGNNQ